MVPPRRLDRSDLSHLSLADSGPGLRPADIPQYSISAPSITSGSRSSSCSSGVLIGLAPLRWRKSTHTQSALQSIITTVLAERNQRARWTLMAATAYVDVPADSQKRSASHLKYTARRAYATCLAATTRASHEPARDARTGRPCPDHRARQRASPPAASP